MQKESVIAGQRRLILGRALYGRTRFGASTEKKSRGITGKDSSNRVEGLDELQTNFCKLYHNLYTRIGKIRNAKVKAELSKP